jgi:hypothetical protein
MPAILSNNVDLHQAQAILEITKDEAIAFQEHGPDATSGAGSSVFKETQERSQKSLRPFSLSRVRVALGDYQRYPP